ncbi:tetratricopeptide repeat protein [Propionivibrio dicarboxylicus]|uniref:Flp pilus assembly protein TadD, contains TPR repeats n=1 Tax=Propionivibrio dicarboxylicus TaxID=83767 RepID=A0A1G7V497_9RHOO|nr:tetratricopeptide repeat protein [Propionivibrio dicarboxylicus]SDG54586.1 Flp pilus assembly protein TadD, contains TPR repeats [Propionivibrio dicarboxylicus]
MNAFRVAFRVNFRQTRLTVLAIALATGVSLAAAADDTTTHRKRPVRSERAVAATVVEPGATDASPSIGQVVFQVLLGEIALRRGEAPLAATAYADLALKTQDPKLLERTVEIAGFTRRFDLALQAAQRWVEVEPDSKQAPLMLASVMIMSNQTENLPALLIRMLEQDRAALGDNLLGLNRMLARLPDRVSAFHIIERVGRAFPDQAEAHYAISVAAAGAGQQERARAEARRALEDRPDWEIAALLHAQLLTRLSPVESIDFLQGFADRYPKARDVRMQLARLLVGQKRYDDARRQFNAVLDLSPDSADALFSLGILALQQNDLDEAEKQFKRFLASPATDKNYAYFFLGQIAEERGKSAEALGYYAQLTGGEHYVQARLRGARLLIDQGRFDEAQRLLASAKASSADERTQLAIAEAGLLRDAKQSQQAFDLLDALLAKQPDQPDLLYESALLAEKLGNIPLMETRLRRLIELRPDSAQAYNALGYSLADRNERLAEARELIERALKLSPEDYFILDSMGWVLFRQGDLAGALDYLQQAYARRDDPEIAAHIGEVLWAQGRPEDARKMWLEAQKKHPANEALSEVIKKFLP